MFSTFVRNHPLEIYLDVMEATLHVLLKRADPMIIPAYRRMEGDYLRWAKKGFEVNGTIKDR